jgi:hypothetical protein
MKKGALNLSIQLIVVIVIAFVVLGLGLTFVRGLFGDLTGISDTAFEEISESLATDLETSGSSLIFSKSKLSLERGGDSLQAFGVRNDEQAAFNYGFNVKAINCPKQQVDAACLDVSSWFDYVKGDNVYTVKAAERQINKVDVRIPKSPDAVPGTYLIRLTAYQDQWDNNNCVALSTGSSTCTLIGQTELFLTIT